MNEPQPSSGKSSTPAADLTEGQYLADQVSQASAAIGAAFTALKSDLAKGVDPKGLTKQHPWMAIGGAAVAGFLAANALVPSKEEQALKKLERIERALNPHPATPRPAAPESPEPKSMTGRVFAELLSAIKPALSSALAAYAAAQSSHHAAPPTNGHAPAAAAYDRPDADTDQQV